MKKEIIFSGVGTALITPLSDGRVDYAALHTLIEKQIDAGIDALIIGGTTAEAATLSDSERYELFAFAAACIEGRCKLIFGTGTNDTRAAIAHTKRACQVGCDGVLVVTPYYNKGTDEGIVNHYLQIAENSTAPVLLYNVPTRTGVNLTIPMLRELCEHENIVGIKEAHDSLERMISLCELRDKLSLYAGNDSAFYATLALGGEGVISVASNAYPDKMKKIHELWRKGALGESLAEQIKLLPLIRALFLQTNPAPIKYLMSKLGLCTGELRLPLSEVTDKTKAQIDEAIASL